LKESSADEIAPLSVIQGELEGKQPIRDQPTSTVIALVASANAHPDFRFAQRLAMLAI
jgi:hypothetical protein